MDKFEVLKKYFGYTSFRGGQEKLIDAILECRDALGIMPTGGGKSLCYQIPALMYPGVAIVISPLISLMKDQVMALKASGISAAYINSSLTTDQQRTVYTNLKNGKYKILYIAPERLQTDDFISLAEGLAISVVAIDEAHCISQWGNDFRPSYLKIADFIEGLSDRPIVAAFTATATERVRKDIEKKLKMRTPVRVVTGFDRPNLRFEVITEKKKPTALLKLLTERKNKSGIIYCMTRNNVETVCELLNQNGISATRYHAGLTDEERRKNQDDFVYDRKNVMVATNAFGMGIDKSNVSFVIHYNMPMSLEAYYQEAGRAGRDGSAADCILLYSPRDIYTAKRLIEHSEEKEQLSREDRELLRRSEYKRLNLMIDYCKSNKCLRGLILDYFGQSHDTKCHNCGNCSAVIIQKDITANAEKILLCVKRIEAHLGYSVGATMIANILHGSKEIKIINKKLTELKSYGVMSDQPKQEIIDTINRLVDLGYLEKDSLYGSLRLSDKSDSVIYDGEKIIAETKTVRCETKKKNEKTGQKRTSAKYDEELYEKLRLLRLRLAAEQNVPPFVIFSNSSLFDMTVKLPQSIEEFLTIPGVGNTKAGLYGEVFIMEIKKHIDTKTPSQ